MKHTETVKETAIASDESTAKVEKVCGIIMPISAIDGLSESHWQEVKDIITECVQGAGFKDNLVSAADEIGVIQKRIIQNLYDNPVVVCDVSGKNPNVMFELGLRLAFDKPTIIIKDDQTAYSFDTSPIEHLEYPRDLRYQMIVDFKNRLTEKIMKTYDASIADKNYSTFLKAFGDFKVAKLSTTEVTPQILVFEELRAIRSELSRLSFDKDRSEKTATDSPIKHLLSLRGLITVLKDGGGNDLTVSVPRGLEKVLTDNLMAMFRVKGFVGTLAPQGRFNLKISFLNSIDAQEARRILEELQ